MKKILIVEDEPDILNLLDLNLQQAGFEVYLASNGIEALEKIKKIHPDLLILDLMLPGIDGLEVCKEIKKDPETASIPVLMLTAKGEEVDRIVGFELGADDYVVKPFSIRELVLRIKAILRRQQEPLTNKVWTYDGLKLDKEKMQFWVDQKEVKLTSTEFKLLTELIVADGKVLSREQLLSRVWGYDFEGYARTVDTHIRRLRKKMGSYADVIETVRGMGYKLKLG
ncbi:two-component system, OmpR family, phosphate regulon response regulator PhoB [Desulfonauticus submarinus]|uniref:Phosphate regulon transcriptional regulatory protein PhoB n=1 Tax=Desulfonauticus submarinus TaxID=206665 RepID=A0A1H0ESD8_9BACT|nr:response regulator [Desulfonauticus submarinus]SDN85282.1 two-component system, OmpR family, phosphate regulon response regulator PhoB [Desulfonauticus submarinus]